MAAAYDWDINKIVELYKWRSAKGEMQQMQGFDWGAWNAKFWEFAGTNFTTPILVLSIGYLTLGQLFVFAKEKSADSNRRPNQFPCFWLFLMPGLSQLLILRGALWRHQTWERPLAVFIAIAAALGIMTLKDLIKKINNKIAAATVVILTALILIVCIKGTNYYYSVRWQPDAKINMFKKLNAAIASDKRLLSFEDFMVNQHKSKGGFYRPEIAWYLDREIDTARTLQEIQQKAETGKYPYYLMPLSYYDQQMTAYLNNLGGQLRKLYRYEYIAGAAGERTKDGKFLKAGMSPYFLFDLGTSKNQTP